MNHPTTMAINHLLHNPLSPMATPPQEDQFFTCNICLASPSDPILTLCGHLFCWPCIYPRLHAARCHVCTAPVSAATLIPLYGQRSRDPRASGIPTRPAPPQHPRRPMTGHDHDDHRRRSRPSRHGPTWRAAGPGGTMGIAILQAMGVYGSGGRYVLAERDDERVRRREKRVEAWLHQLWVFLFCCGLFCLVFF